jgi:hypothetical protein
VGVGELNRLLRGLDRLGLIWLENSLKGWYIDRGRVSGRPASWKARLEFGIMNGRMMDGPRDYFKLLERAARRAAGEPERRARCVQMKLGDAVFSRKKGE